MPSLDFSHGSGLVPNHIMPPGDVSRLVTAAIDDGLAAAALTERRRTYVGASEIGAPCLRQLFYRATQPPREPVDSRMRRIWGRGHAAEDRIISWLRQAGFVITDRVDGRQLRFHQLDGRFSGGVDGIVTDGPLELPYPVLLELKCIRNRSWQDLIKTRLVEFSYQYYWQVNVYLAYLGLRHCLFGAENADTCELYWELVPLDLPAAQAASDRAVQLIRMIDDNELPPRIAVSPDHWVCRMCEHQEICWK